MAKKIPEQELEVRMGEALARILTLIQDAIDKTENALDDQKVAQAWLDDLIELLAKRECKRHYDLPAWSKLKPQQRRRLLTGAENTLLAIRDFWQEKVVAQNG